MTNIPDEEITIDEDYAEEIGVLVFQSALMRFVAEREESTIASFQVYINENAEQEDFMITLCETYPDFEQILLDEMIILDQELRSVTDQTD